MNNGNNSGKISTLACLVFLAWVIVAIYMLRNMFSRHNYLIEEMEEIDRSISDFSLKDHSLSHRPLTGSPSFRGQSKDAYFHIVFSTDCSFFQDWQTLLVFHSASVVKQQGTITRIASGCNEEKKAELIVLYKKLFPRYHVHFTPDFKKDSKTGKSYDFYNKPYGLQHWLNNTKAKENKEEIIVLIDPDMIFLRPLSFEVKDNKANIYMKDIDPNGPEIPERYTHGHPVAQLYGLGAPWTNDRGRNFNRTNICGSGSPCLGVTAQYGENHFRYTIIGMISMWLLRSC